MRNQQRSLALSASLALIGLWLCCQPVLAATNIYMGGDADGYAEVAVAPRMGYPYVHNANGATGVLDQSAWMNGYLAATGTAETTVYVYWGQQDQGTSRLNWAHGTNFGVRAERENLTTNVVGLNPNTIYYYRFYASNADGYEAWAGNAASFATPGPVALNNGWGAGPVSFTTATLSGILTKGESADIFIYWGQNTNNWANTNSLGSRGEGAFWTGVTGLSESATYYYRCYATNGLGEAWTAPVSFTTWTSFSVFAGGDADGYDDHTQSSLMSIRKLGTVFIVL